MSKTQKHPEPPTIVLPCGLALKHTSKPGRGWGSIQMACGWRKWTNGSEVSVDFGAGICLHFPSGDVYSLDPESLIKFIGKELVRFTPTKRSKR